jgi:aryl-phospho-beta-D-glucosidase BglC (GH1 family)
MFNIKKDFKVYKKAIISILSVVVLTFIYGCGGGASGSNTPVTVESYNEGYFIDSPVEGLGFRTNTLSGFTDENGKFFYKDNESVTFFFDKMTIGTVDTVPSDKKITPQDVVGVDRSLVSNANVLKISRFLQSFDDDGEISSRIKLIPVSFDSQNLQDLSIDAISTLVTSKSKTFKTENDVVTHLNDSLSQFNLTTTNYTPPSNNDTPSNTSSSENSTTTVTTTDQIKIDQFGYLPDMKKIAIISIAKEGFNADTQSDLSTTLHVKRVSDDVSVFSALTTLWNDGATDSASGDKVYRFDFSTLMQEGEYYIYDDTNKLKSYTFKIASNVYEDVLKVATKTFFYQRAGFEKDKLYATNWEDNASHLHVEQDSQARLIVPTDPTTSDMQTQKDLSGGWYDAGDFNKYVNYADGALHDLLFAYEENPDIWSDSFDINESGNGIADILDEVKYELDWLLKMQEDNGSVIHKIASIEWGEVSPPSSDMIARRYSQVSSSATISFAGVLAHASLVFKDINSEYSQKLQNAATKAWQYMSENSDFINSEFDNSGFVNAAAEDTVSEKEKNLLNAAIYLFRLTKNEQFHKYIKDNKTTARLLSGDAYLQYDAMDKESQDALLYYTKDALADDTLKNEILSSYKSNLSNEYVDFAPLLQAKEDKDAYMSYIDAYYWGSNRAKANAGLSLYNAKTYEVDVNVTEIGEIASNFLHYFHGLNPLAKTYLSNMGDYGAENSVDEFYHMWFSDGSKWDSVKDSFGPPPGFIVGGANASYNDSDTLMPDSTQKLKEQPASKAYKDFNTILETSYKITENSITYQAAYIRLLSKFVSQSNTLQNSFKSEYVVKKFEFLSDTENFVIPYSGACDVAQSSSEHNESLGSLHVSNRAQTYVGAMVDVTDMLSADTLYVIRGKIKTLSATSDTYVLNAKINGETPVYIELSRILVDDNDWNHFKTFVTFTQEQLDDGVFIYVNSSSRKDEYYLDDIEIVTTAYDPLSQDSSSEILQVSSNKIVDKDNSELKIKGINVIAYSDDQSESSEDFWNYTYFNIDKHDLINIKDMGFNAIRISLWYKYFEEDSAPNVYKNSGFSWLDTIVGWAKEAGIYVMLDMHAPQGGGFQGPGSSNDFWTDSAYQTRFKNLWKAIAQRYKNESTIYAYDIINEPLAPDESEYRTLVDETITTIREQDSKHIINVEVSFSTVGSGAGEPFKLDGVENIVYDFHFYDPWNSFTDDDGAVYGTDVLQTSVRALFEDVSTFYTSNNIAYSVSEFGQKYDNYTSKNSDGWVRDLFDIMKSNSLNSYFYFSYKGNEFSIYENGNKYSYSSSKNDTLIETLKLKNSEY